MPLPADYNTVLVRGRYVYLDGSNASGAVKFTGKALAVSASTDTVILPATITANLVNGQFSVNLPATDDPDIAPNGWTYKVEETFSGGRTFEIEVSLASVGTGIDLSKVAPTTATTGDPTAFVTLTTFNESLGSAAADAQAAVTAAGEAQDAAESASARVNAATYGIIYAREHGVSADGVTNDAPAIQAAIDAAAPGQTVQLPPGRLLLGSALVPKPMVTVRAGHGNRTDTPQDRSVLVVSPAFSGSSVFRLLDMEEGGYATENEGVRLVNLTVDGAGSPAGVGGIAASGRVHGLVLDRVAFQNLTGPVLTMATYTRTDGKVTKPFSWNLWNCMATECNGDAWRIDGATDCTLENVQALGCKGSGFVLVNAANTQMNGCRSEWSGDHGLLVTGNWLNGQGSGGALVNGFSTDRNSKHGIHVNSTGAGQIELNGLMLRRDGRNGFPGVGGGEYAGLNVDGATTPVVVDGIVVYPGVSDDGTGVNSPQYGVAAKNATALIVDGSGYVHAATKVWHDGGGNTVFHRGLGVFGATGPTSSPTRETVTHLDVTGRVLGQAFPREHGLAAWAFDPAMVNSGKAAVSGTLHLTAVYVPRPVAVSAIRWGINTAGVSPVAGQNFVGLFSSAGQLLASAGVDADVTATGLRSTAITAQTLAPGLYWVAWLFNAGTPPAVYRSPGDLNATLLNANIGSAAQYRFATNGTGRTALPASITPSSNSPAQFSYWAGLA